MNKKILILLIIILLAVLTAGLFYFFRDNNENRQEEMVFDTETGNSVLLPEEETTNKEIEQVAAGLSIPWEIVFLPDQSMLVTQRPGNLLRVSSDGKTEIKVNDVAHIGEGGLLGMALHPEYASNNFIYLYYTSESAGSLENKVVRFVFDETENRLNDELAILEGIPGNSNHNGGRIAFGPDGFLYISTGDAGNGRLSQNPENLAGKILRIDENGDIPDDNPFGNEVYSYGHRNPQGLAFDSRDRLWISEHGPSGLGSGYDEINLIEKGGNYGWPDFFGDENGTGMIAPLIQSGANDTWAPSGLAIINDRLYFAGLRGQAIYSVEINNDRLENFKTHFKNDYGRLRALIEHEGRIFFSTSNTDGRGNPSPGDDKIIRVDLSVF